MIRNILIVLLLIGLGYLGFQNFTLNSKCDSLGAQLEQKSAELRQANAKIAKLTHHQAINEAETPQDYVSLASLHYQRAEQAFAAHDFKLAAQEGDEARLDAQKAAAQDIDDQKNEVNSISQRVAHFEGQIKALGDAFQ